MKKEDKPQLHGIHGGRHYTRHQPKDKANPNVKAQRRLDARRKDFDETIAQSDAYRNHPGAFRRPGSMKK